MKPDPLPAPGADLKTAILGVWSLISREDYDAAGARLVDPILGADPIGILTFAPKQFAAQFMKRSRGASGPSPAAGGGTSAAAAGANNSSAMDGYDAYFGTYDLDLRSGTITVALEGSVVPANIGLRFTRDVRVTGDRLSIRLATTAADGTPITRTLTFERSR